jgi:hypothetical protein
MDDSAANFLWHDALSSQFDVYNCRVQRDLGMYPGLKMHNLYVDYIKLGEN